MQKEQIEMLKIVLRDIIEDELSSRDKPLDVLVDRMAVRIYMLCQDDFWEI